MAREIFKIALVMCAIFFALIVLLLFLFVIFVYPEDRLYDDFVSGRAVVIDKIVIENASYERIFDDKESMEYLERSFSSLKRCSCNNGATSNMYIYYKSRPKLYVYLFVDGLNPDKACFWINGYDGSEFEFDLPKPYPKGIRNMIDFIYEK